MFLLFYTLHPCCTPSSCDVPLVVLLQATELFELSAQDLFSGSSRRELLACLLKELQVCLCVACVHLCCAGLYVFCTDSASCNATCIS
jgi:hypothetical protein